MNWRTKAVQFVCGVLTRHGGYVERDPAGNLNHQCATCGKWGMKVVHAPKLTVELAPFDWLEEYGPHWHPGSTAFWLEPKTKEQLLAWVAKYRPGEIGVFEANESLRVEITRITRKQTVYEQNPGANVELLKLYANQYANQYANSYVQYRKQGLISQGGFYGSRNKY